MKNLLKNIIVIIFFTHSDLLGQSDLLNSRILGLSSPDALGLELYGHNAEASYSGSPNINVPLYNIEVDAVNIPIQLIYNTNLVKPDIKPGWVGLGWTLLAGGAITRAINDKPDEFTYFDRHIFRQTDENQVGYLFNHNYLKEADWYSDEKIYEASSDLTNYDDFSNKFAGLPFSVKDYAPDEFTISCPGLSASFFLDANGKFVTKSNQKIKIEYDMVDLSGIATDQPSGFGSFTITNDLGIKYKFGGELESIELSASLFTFTKQIYVPKTWFLTEVVLPNGKNIKFTYERGKGIIFPMPRDFWNKKLYFLGSIIMPSYLRKIETSEQDIVFLSENREDLPFKNSRFTNQNISYQLALESNLNAPPKMINIHWGHILQVPGYQNTYITVIEELKHRKLTQITVKNKHSDRVIKDFSFRYVENIEERLKLLNLVETNSHSKHSFSYNSSKLPDYFMNLNDLWGFYNGLSINLDGTKEDLEASRVTVAEKLQSEILTEIRYPTGGYTTFDFEPNDYNATLPPLKYNDLVHFSGSAKIASGLRVKTVKNYSGNNILAKETNFKYSVDPFDNESKSSGILEGLPYYVYYYINGDHLMKVDLNPNYPVFNSNHGGMVGYSKVTEIVKGEGYKVTEYSNYGTDQIYDEEPPVNLYSIERGKAFISNEFLRGKIKKQTFYSESKDKIKEVSFNYRTPDKSKFVRGLNTEYDVGFAYKIYTYDFLIKDVETKVFGDNENDASFNKTSYIYNEYNLVREESFTSSVSSNNFKYKYTYPTDLYITELVETSPPNTWEERRSYYIPFNLNMHNYPIEKLKIRSNSIIESEITTFKQFNYTYKYFPFKNFSNDGSKPVSEYIEAQLDQRDGQVKVDESNSLKFEVLKYDASGNVLEIIDKTSGLVTSYVWGYEANYLLAKVTNNTYANLESSGIINEIIKIQSFNLNEEEERNAFLDQNDLIRNLINEDAHIETFTHEPLVGLTSIVDKNNKAKFYRYDNANRLMEVRDSDFNIEKVYSYNIRD